MRGALEHPEVLVTWACREICPVVVGGNFSGVGSFGGGRGGRGGGRGKVVPISDGKAPLPLMSLNVDNFGNDCDQGYANHSEDAPDFGDAPDGFDIGGDEGFSLNYDESSFEMGGGANQGFGMRGRNRGFGVGGSGNQGYGMKNNQGFNTDNFGDSRCGGINNFAKDNIGGGGGFDGGMCGFSDQPDNMDGPSVHFRGLPWEAVESDVCDFLLPLEPVQVIIYQNNSGQSTGEADVYFNTHEEAMEAVGYDHGNIGNRYIEITLNDDNTGGRMQPLFHSECFHVGIKW